MSKYAKIAIIFSFLLTITGCAFFNTLYNGWQAFNKGIKLEEQLSDEGKDSTEIKKATQKDYERALKKAEKAVSYYPKSVKSHDDAYFLKGRALYQMGEYSAAIPVFKYLQKHYPKSKRIPQSWLYLGMSYAELGDYDNANETYQYIIDNYPQLNSNQEILLLKADLAIKTKGQGEAVKFLEDAYKRVSDPQKKIYIIYRLAEIYYNLNMYEKALSYTTEKPKIDKSYKDLYYKVSLIEIHSFIELNQIAKAEKLIYSLLKNKYYGDKREELHYELAIVKIDERKFKEARKLLEDLVATEQKSEIVAKSWWQLSKIDIDFDNKLEDGIEDLKKVVDITSNAELKNKAQQRLEGLNLVNVYKDSLENGTPDSIDSWEVRYKLGEEYWLNSKLPDSALVQYDTILSDTSVSDSIYLKTLYAKGWILYNIKKDTTLATTIFDSLLSKYPTTVEAKDVQEMLGIPVTVMTRVDSAQAEFKQAENERIKSGLYSKKSYYMYLLTALKYKDIDSIAAKSLYAAGMDVINRAKSKNELDTVSTKVFATLCHEYPNSEQCKEASKMLDNGKVKLFTDSYDSLLVKKELAQHDTTEEISDTATYKNSYQDFQEENQDSTKAPIEIPNFKDWF